MIYHHCARRKTTSQFDLTSKERLNCQHCCEISVKTNLIELFHRISFRCLHSLAFLFNMAGESFSTHDVRLKMFFSRRRIINVLVFIHAGEAREKGKTCDWQRALIMQCESKRRVNDWPLKC